ncbi:MAG TPA: phosphatidylserine/phosphatidylglycerophosphate/cardiolipin synthase family protein [Dongiaceae bacterium]|nr:phosphatidylserine/phosphatidylglycerophosphate/cardiolipin synthase family protein [Dongiaceae bacterium]
MSDHVVENLICTLPWRLSNRIELLVDGDQFFPRILDACAQAQHSIDIELYLFESGYMANRFITTLAAAVARGVRVRLLLDHVGSYHLEPPDQQRIADRGIELRYFNPLTRNKLIRNLSRDHRKIITVDQRLAFVGGAGVTDEFSSQVSGQRAWRELMVEIQGPVVHDWQILFERAWANHDALHREHLHERVLHWRQPTFNAHHMNREIPQARVNATRGLGNKPIIGALMSEMKKADNCIWLSTAYFFPSRRLLNLLRKAARKGIDVRLLLPGPYTDHPSVRFAGRSWYTLLLKDGVRIYEYQPRFLHMKLALVDDWCSLGSCNFDRWNLRWNLEANMEVIDHEFACQVEAMLVNDFAQSVEYTLELWKQRSLLEKIRERLWKYIGMFLNRITNQ